MEKHFPVKHWLKNPIHIKQIKNLLAFKNNYPFSVETEIYILA